MSFQSHIIDKVKLNKEHARHCEDCFFTTTSMNFWIWDPKNNPEIPYAPGEAPESNYAQILFLPTSRQRQESLEVKCLSDKDRTLIALDKCLIPDKNNKCEGLIFEGIENPSILIWVELKMGVKRKNQNPKTLEDRIIGEGGDNKNAFDQIISAINFFEEKGIDTSICQNQWHIAIPKDMKINANKSNAIQARIRKELKGYRQKKLKTITIGPVLELD